ncbi:PAS domain S-box protein [Pontiellaceae bacterium B12219]|nr:PAS domain S-box protein [Pontiellaceae bacterium B12219]
MKIRNTCPSWTPGRLGALLLTATLLLPAVSQAQSTRALIIPVEMSMAAYLIIGFLLLISITMFFIFQRRFNRTARELNDVTSELSVTRTRLAETGTRLEQEKAEHKGTTERYTNILFDANVGMFQMDLNGKCTFINTTLQQMSGLYPKKALKEGLESAIHPDDKQMFRNEWDAFAADDQGTFEHTFRFLGAKGREIHAVCKANKVRNTRKDVESYIGWVSDITPYHEEVLSHQAETGHFETFVSETVEGYYKLIPDAPISLRSKPEKVSAQILNNMIIGDCNETFAAMYGATAAELIGKTISDLKDGCGPFKSAMAIEEFIKSDYQTIDVESIRQDPNGNRLNLLNNALGIVEDNKLVGIWGHQRNISQQKREKAELASQIGFMHRIINSLPADVHVKDTRCRYLYASKKLSDRTGIPQEDWIGKTIYEVMPATPREHDQLAIEAMKSGKLLRCERTYEAKGKKGWMENLQIPLVSDEGLTEGVVSLSLEISDRKQKEVEAVRLATELETKLVNSQNELADTKNRHLKTAANLSEVTEKMNRAEAVLAARESEFQEALNEHKRTEDSLRRSEQGLLARQQQLEEKLAKRLEELEKESDKRMKWEELLQIKEDELRRLEENLAELREHYAQETSRRESSELHLKQAQQALDEARTKVNELSENRERELEELKTVHTQELSGEQGLRKKAEKHLAQTQEFLESAQEQIKRMTDQHATELETEVAERKATAEKLMNSLNELDELRRTFNERVTEETKAARNELARKQIREAALRKHEKDLEKRIHELESTLNLKSKEFAEQIQAREGAEVEKNELAQKMEQLTQRQKELVNSETQKLSLSIAEIRIEEVKHRKKANELEREKEELIEKLRIRENFVEKARIEQQKAEAELQEALAELKQVSGDQSKRISEETADLQKKLESAKNEGASLQRQLSDMLDEKGQIQRSLDAKTEELTHTAREYRKTVDSLKASQIQLQELTDNQEDRIAQNSGELKAELKKLQRSEQMLQSREEEFNQRIKMQQAEIDKLSSTLKDETDLRYEAEKTLRELEVTLKVSQENADTQLLQQTKSLKAQIEKLRENESHLSTELKLAEATVLQRDKALAQLKQERTDLDEQLKQVETRIETLKKDHLAELEKSIYEIQEVSRMNDQLVEELNTTIQSALKPVVKSTQLLEQSENLTKDQKLQLSSANHQCRSLIDTMNYRAELTKLSSGNQKLTEGEFDLHTLMTDMDQQFAPRAKINNLLFTVSFAQHQASHNVPKRIVSDEDKLKKTLSILLGYALQQTEKGRIGLHASRETSDSDHMQIAFELTFTPANAHDDLLNNIFATNAEAAIDLQYGLTLARRYIKMLEGEVELEYRDAGVTALSISFPFKETAADINLPDSDENEQAGAA